MLNLNYLIQRKTQLYIFVKQMEGIPGLYIKLDVPFIDRYGNEYNWFITKEDAKGFITASRSIQEGNEFGFRVVKLSSNFVERAHMEIKIKPRTNPNWVNLSIVHWAASLQERLHLNKKPNMSWNINLRTREFENIITSLMFFYDL